MRLDRIYILSGVIVVGVCFIFFYSPTKLSLYKSTTTTPTPLITEGVDKTGYPGVEPPRYAEVVDGCNPYFVGECINVREGPSKEYASTVRLRTGVVLRVGDVVKNKNNELWYPIIFTHKLLYPERVKGTWYVSADFVKLITDTYDYELKKGDVLAPTTKYIIVDVSEQKLYAYEGKKLFMEESISTGLEFTPTPRGVFSVFKMTPSRFMQGPIPGVSDQVYDLPGVPWNLYFTSGGDVIHGAYWHDHFGKPWSHGCINLSPENAKKLYRWAEIGIKVTVQN